MSEFLKIKSGNKETCLTSSKIEDSIFLKYCEMIPEEISQIIKTKDKMTLPIQTIARLIRGLDKDIKEPDLFEIYKDIDSSLISDNNLDAASLLEHFKHLRERLDILLIETVTCKLKSVTINM